MFKSRPKERLIFTNRRRRRSRFSLLWVLLFISLSLLTAELIARIIVDISGEREKFAQASTQPDLTSAYQLKFVNETQKPYKTLPTEGSLVAKRSLSVGYELVGGQQNQYWQINEQGFRDRDLVPVAKPQDEIRIFVLGGSTAFGYGIANNSVDISNQLELRLQQRIEQQQSSPQLYKPDVLPYAPAQLKIAEAKPAKIKQGKYRVVNAAVPGYASGNELAHLALKILNYKPDLIIVLDGYVDLMLPSAEQATQIPQLDEYLDDAPTYFRAYISQAIEPLEAKSYLAKIAQNQFLDPEKSQRKASFVLHETTPNLVRHLASNEAELQQRLDRYVEHQKQILNLCAAARIPLIVALQPEITGRNPSKLSKTESAIVTQLGREYIRKVKDTYPLFAQANHKLAKAFPQNLKALNLYDLSDKYPTPSFIDAIHLNAEANQQVAEQLYYAISGMTKMQIVPKTPPPPKQPINTINNSRLLRKY